MPESEEELWRRLKESGDQGARERLAETYLPFARSLAMRYRGASESADDLVQVASVGLLNAIDRYEPQRGTPFMAFAAPTVLGELKRHFRDRVWTVRVPRGQHDRLAEVEKAVAELTGKLGRSPSVKEIAAQAEIDEMDVLEAMEADRNRRALSLDKPTGGEDPDDPTPSEWLGQTDESYDLVEGRVALEESIPHLDERERLVLRLRFVEDMTQSQIAERIGHSQMHVSRILRGTLDKIRERIEAEAEEAGVEPEDEDEEREG